jgi:sulfite exporter TauE/SafE
MEFLPLAFLMGLLSSLHCAVMCGPIMLGMPFQKRSQLSALLHLLSYQGGRITVYLFLGGFVGLLSTSIRVFSNQKVLSIIIGSLLILFTLFQFFPLYQKRLSLVQQHFSLPIGKLMTKVLKLPFWPFFAGMLNGLIPCGMVYLALATALNTGSIGGATQFMLLFGLGTLPLLLVVSWAGIYLKKYIRLNTQKLLPWFMLLMGILLILRSIDLGIPFISPSTHQGFGQAVICN